MINFLSLILSLLSTQEAFACAMCAGQNPNDKYYLYIVGIFILLIYIPMFYMYKTVVKYKNINSPKKQD
jgi:phosphotransferase system  glucose/maltose/N-acetylglucosamine-specific IIC component